MGDIARRHDHALSLVRRQFRYGAGRAMTAEPQCQSGEPSVVLVHGANHDGWCWTIVVGLLENVGIRSHVVDLPLSSLESDCRAVAVAVDRAASEGPVLVVTHSYGGLPVSIAAERADALIYVAARMPLRGQSPAERTSSWNTPEFTNCVRREDGVMTLASHADGVLYNTTPRSLRDLARARWRPMRSGVPVQPVANPVWEHVPTVYVVCTADRAVDVAAQREAATHADEMIELDCDHSPFFSAPSQLAAVVEFEVAAMRSRTGLSGG
ncbi:alpha/beta fold hydrolase [Rhodococcus pyridinivorans]